MAYIREGVEMSDMLMLGLDYPRSCRKCLENGKYTEASDVTIEVIKSTGTIYTTFLCHEHKEEVYQASKAS